VTLDELDSTLPNGFHDVEIFSIELDYSGGRARFRMSLLVGSPDAPAPERDKRQEATLNLAGLCFCSIEAPDPRYAFIPNGAPVIASGDPGKPDHLPSLPALAAKWPEGVWCYRFFVDNWNAFIYIAARHAEIDWIGATPIPAE
jgi:hypothetical protein